MQRTAVAQITGRDVADMVQHWLATPENGYFGLDYGSSAAAIVQQPITPAVADDLVVKLYADLPILAGVGSDAVSVLEVPAGVDRKLVLIDVMGEQIALQQQG